MLGLLSAYFNEAVVIAVFVNVALCVADDDSDFFVRADAAEHIVQGVEYVCCGAERLALLAEFFARARRNRFAAGARCDFAARRSGAAG